MGMAFVVLATNSIDFAGPFLSSMFLVAVDAHSRWLEVGRKNDFFHFRNDH